MSFTSVINADEKACRSRATSFSHLDREARCYLEETMVYGLTRSEFFGIFRIPDGAVGIRLNHIPWNDENLRDSANTTADRLWQAHLEYGIPPSLLDLLHLAGEDGIRYLIFDEDAPAIEGLPTYDD